MLLENRSELPTSLHAHGVRMDAPFDGTGAITHGAAAAYTLRFPDAGVHWYHSHAREDYTQEMGMYGNEDFRFDTKRNELIRFFLTNACNTRLLALNFFRGGNLKVVGSDNWRYAWAIRFIGPVGLARVIGFISLPRTRVRGG